MTTREKAKPTSSTSSAKPQEESALPPGTDAADERLLDEAISETFPASDPISPAIPERRTAAAPAAASTRAPSGVDPSAAADAESDGGSRSRTRQQEIQRIAHERFVSRGSQPGSELTDWLSAEKEVDAREDARDASA
jgi:hypothetical protein